MSENMIRELAQDIAEATARLTQARVEQMELKYQCELAERDTLHGIDYKGLGSNEAERKLRMEELLANSSNLQQLREMLHQNAKEVLLLEGKLEEVVALRRGEEWAGRLLQAEALLQRGRTQGTDRDVAEGVEEALEEATYAATIDTLWGPNDDEATPIVDYDVEVPF